MNTVRKLLVGLIACAFAWPLTISAQLEEIIVTSQFREQNVQDVPITISTLGGEEMTKADIFDAGTIAANVPGMNYTEFAPGQANISMRGVNSADDGAGLDNSVSVFLDGIYIGRGASINFDMFDLERVEILKGPQGTLFGRNSIGGAISVVTSKPTGETGGKIGVTVGNEGILRLQGFVNGALGDNLAGKLVVNHRSHDGFVDNVLLGTKLQDEDQTSVRGQLAWSGANSDWLLSVDTMEDDRTDMGRTPFADNAPLSLIGAANGITGPRQNASPYDGYSVREASGISLTGDFQCDSGTLTSITGYRTAETDWEMQSVGVGLGAIGLPFDEVIDKIQEEIDTISQEFRWTSTLDGNFNYTAGAYFFQEETDRPEQFQITAAGTYAPGFVQTAVGSQTVIGNEYTRTQNETTSWALYGQAEWTFNDQWSATLGARYTKDDKDYTATAVDCGGTEASRAAAGFPNFAECQGRGGSLSIVSETFQVTPSDSWDDFSPKATLSYQPNDKTMIFGSVTRGFKSGGFAGSQGVQALASAPVDPETATNFELGIKTDLADDTLRLNATAFFTDLEDLQVVRFGPVPGSTFGTFQTTNIGTADITGFEIDFAWYPTDNFSLSGYYAHLDTEVNDLIIPTTAVPTGFDASGRSLTRAPESTYNLVAQYEFGAFDFRLSYSHSDEVTTDYIDLRTIAEENDLLDARIGWSNDNFEIALWGKNLTDEDYISHTYVIGPGVIGVWGAPATYGITGTLEF